MLPSNANMAVISDASWKHDPVHPAPNRTAIATQLGVPEITCMGDGEMARTVVDPMVQLMFAEEIKEHVKRTRKLDEHQISLVSFMGTIITGHTESLGSTQQL